VNRSALVAALVIAMPIAALLGPHLLGDRSFSIRDAGHFYHPMFQWCCREWAAGRVPMWNPYENCGAPVLADASSSVLYPGKLLFMLPVDFSLAYKLYVALHVVLAAAASYWLARRWSASPPAAALAAIAYACGGNVVFQYANVVFLVGAAWLPLAALAAERMFSKLSWSASLSLGAILALMILGGDPQMAYHALLIAILFGLVILWAQPRDPTARHVDTKFTYWRQMALLATAAGTAFALAAVQVLPSAELTRHSQRAAFNRPRNVYEAAAVVRQPASRVRPLSQSRWQVVLQGLFSEPEAGTHQEVVYDFSVGPWRLIEYVWPNVSGQMFPTNRRWLSALPAEGRIWNPTLYMGLVPIVLACTALRIRSGRARQRWLTALVLLFTLASFGYYGCGWLVREIYGTLLRQDASQLTISSPLGGLYWLMVTLLPGFACFRYPAKLLPLVALGLSQLAAVGFDRTLRGRRSGLGRLLVGLGMFSGVAAIVFGSIGRRLLARVTTSDTFFGPFDADGAYRNVLSAFTQTALIAIAAQWLLQRVSSNTRRAATWQWAVVLLTGVELAVANAWLVATAPAHAWRQESPIAAAIHDVRHSDATGAEIPPRVFRGNLASWQPRSFRASSSVNRPAQIVQWEHDTLFPKHELTADIGLVEAYASIKLLDYDSLLAVARHRGPRMPDKSRLPQPTALRLTGTQFLVLPDIYQPPSAERIEEAVANWPESASLWRMQRTFPRAWIVHHIAVFQPLPQRPHLAEVDLRTQEVLFPDDVPRDFLATAVVETDEPLEEWVNLKPSANPPLETEPCRFAHYDPHRVRVEARLAQPGLLVLTDSWYPGWRAFALSGSASKELTIYRTNRVFRGVWLPAGEHTVEFRFQPRSFYCGAIVSGLSWFVAAVAAVMIAWRRRHDGSSLNVSGLMAGT
jgi:hypothetical protein